MTKHDDNFIKFDQPQVLIVDDNEDIRSLVTIILAKKGFHCHHAYNGDDALKKISNGLQPDLILSDLHMDHGSGVDFLTALRSNVIYKFIPVILISCDPRGAKIARDACFNGFISKFNLVPELLASQRSLKEFFLIKNTWPI